MPFNLKKYSPSIVSDVTEQNPSVSVLMTVFNAEKYLAASIKSILAQTYEAWELIIIDDASNDRSLEISKIYAQQDCRIRVIENSINKGQTACLNQGLREAQGLWIARQDADDLSHPKRLEEQWNFIQKNPEVKLIGCCGLIIDCHSQCIGLLDMPLSHQVIKWSLPLLNPFLHTGVFFHTEVARTLRGYNEQITIAQDYDLWVRMIAAGVITANLPARLVSYRHLDSSLSKTGQTHAFQEAAKIARYQEIASFGRELSDLEHLLLVALRRGLHEEERSNFWRWYFPEASSFKKKNQFVAPDLSRFTAILHLKVAGNLSSLVSKLQEIMKAFKTAPRFTFFWLWERLFFFIKKSRAF